MSYFRFRPYVPVAKRREMALKEAKKAQKSGKSLSPVVVEGRKIARTVWGEAWCDNLESYSDYENRLPRGRTYVRNGSVIDLVVEPGKVRAQVMGSELYRIEITVAPAEKERWKKLVGQLTGSIASLVELLQGKFSKGVMERICHRDSGLFPSPKEINLSCSCPDWASMCKHVAAALYGVGARLDNAPELLFTLRGVEASELVAEAAKQPAKAPKGPGKGRALEVEALDDLFGIELESEGGDASPVSRKKPGRRAKAGGVAAKPARKVTETSPSAVSEKKAAEKSRSPATSGTKKTAKPATSGKAADSPASPSVRAKRVAPRTPSPREKAAGEKSAKGAEASTKRSASPAGSPGKKSAAKGSSLSREKPPGKRGPGRPRTGAPAREKSGR